MGLSYVLIYLISKQLGAEGAGFYSLMLQILTVAGMVLGLGMNIAVLRYVGQFNNEEQRSKMRDLYRHFVRVVAPLTVLVGVLLYFGADYIAQWTGKGKEYTDGLKMVGIILPFFTINQISVEFIRGLKQLQISELVRSVLQPLLMILGIYFAFWGHLTKMDVIYLLVVSLIINSVVSRWAIWKKLKSIPKQSLAFDRKELMKTALPMLATGVGSILFTTLPIFFIDYYTNSKEVGIYSVVFQITGFASLSLTIVNTIAAPSYSEFFWAEKMKDLKTYIQKSAKLLFYTTSAVSLLLFCFSGHILQLFGEEFIAGQQIFQILLMTRFINSISGSSGVFLNMSGNEKTQRNIILFVLILYVILLSITVPKWSIMGAAISTLICSVLSNVMRVFIVYKKFKILTFYIPFNRVINV